MFMKESVQDEFEQNCFAYLDQLYRLAYARVGNTQDAEDIVQETFIKAFRAKEQFQGRATVRSWLIQILLNTMEILSSTQRQSLPGISSLIPIISA